MNLKIDNLKDNSKFGSRRSEIKYENINDKTPVSFRGIELKEQRNSKYCNGIEYLYLNKYI